jgi:hypothetical protein
MALIVGLALDASAQTPNTDVYLAPLSRIGDSLVVGRAINVTHRQGYDNQPSFLPDSRAILYTVVDSSGRADIWRYDIADRRTTQVTRTPESEYSATVMPGGARFSVIRVELDSTQRLWSFALDGSDPQLVLRDLKPVGYHAWLDSARLVTFVLGSPSTLHVINQDGSGDTTIARDVGRSIQALPTGGIFSFTRREGTARHLSIVLQTRHATDVGTVALIEAPADNEFHAWTPGSVLLSAAGSVLVRLDPAHPSTWIPVGDLKPNGLKNVTRLAVSPDGNWLAFVAEPVTP